METKNAIKALSALAQESRLEVFRLLVKTGIDGLAAGDIARELDLPPNTLSSQLNALANADLVISKRAGRSIIYSANYNGMSELLVYLMDDCCQGRPEICAPLTLEANKVAYCNQSKGKNQ